MRALLVYYSFTGQAELAVEYAATVFRERGVQPTLCRVDFAESASRLKRPLSIAQLRHWTRAAASGECAEISVEPLAALHERYDFVAIFSNTWMNHPSVPIYSFLMRAEFPPLLKDTPFAVYVICRSLWKHNAKIVREAGEAVGGQFMGAQHFEHGGGPVLSLLATIRRLVSASDAPPRIFGLSIPIPRYGFAAGVPEFVAAFTRKMMVLARLPQ